MLRFVQGMALTRTERWLLFNVPALPRKCHFTPTRNDPPYVQSSPNPYPGSLLSRPPGRHGAQQLRGRRCLLGGRLDGRRLLAQLRAQLSAANAPSHGAQDPFLADVD